MPSAAAQGFGLMLNRLAPNLKAKGFLRRGTAFVREKDRNQSVIEFQRNPDRESEKYTFFVNLGYVSRLIYWFESGHSKLPDRPQGFHYSRRLGELVPDRALWGWFIRAPDEAEPLAGGFSDMLESYGLPWHEQHSSDQALIEAFTRSLDLSGGGDIRPLLRLSVLAAARGDKDLAERAITKLTEECEGEPWANTVRAHAEKLSHWNF